VIVSGPAVSTPEMVAWAADGMPVIVASSVPFAKIVDLLTVRDIGDREASAPAFT
jgi:hypothetical protein